MNLTELFNKYHSDKGSLFEAHQYAKDYEQLIDTNIENLLEIGIGADWSRPDWKDPLGNCGSIRGWLEYLPNTTIYGFDIKDCSPDLKEKSQFKMLMGDQSKIEDLNKLKDSIPDCDVIIDDGTHISAHQIMTFSTLWGKVKPGGYYFIEDIHCRWGQAPHTLEALQDNFNFIQFFGRDNHGMVFKKHVF
jgi:8-demethyl-8-alpha-L-rhamnosyltetracenomycin-C 2'-O-methyltransferase